MSPREHEKSRKSKRIMSKNIPMKAKQRSNERCMIMLEKTISWGECYNNLKDYVDNHGDCDVPLDYSPHLHTWVKQQRELYKFRKEGSEILNYVEKSRIHFLEKLGFDWETTICF